jgi:hypothetical protein
MGGLSLYDALSLCELITLSDGSVTLCYPQRIGLIRSQAYNESPSHRLMSALPIDQSTNAGNQGDVVKREVGELSSARPRPSAIHRREHQTYDRHSAAREVVAAVGQMKLVPVASALRYERVHVVIALSLGILVLEH